MLCLQSNRSYFIPVLYVYIKKQNKNQKKKKKKKNNKKQKNAKSTYGQFSISIFSNDYYFYLR